MLTIVKVLVEDYKRIKFAQVDLDSGATVVGGMNENGKSSLLDGIESVLFKPCTDVANPIRRGAVVAKVAAKVEGDRAFTVWREWSRGKDGKVTTELKAIDASGIPIGSAATFLKAFTAQVFYRPSDFALMQPIERRKKVCALAVPPIDWDADYRLPKDGALQEEKRLAAEREAFKSAAVARKTEFEALGVAESEVPDEPVDAAALNAQLQGAKQARENWAERKNLFDGNAALLAERNEELARLQARLAELAADITRREQWAKDNPVPEEPLDVSEAIMAEISALDRTNAAVRAKQAVVRARLDFEAAETRRLEAAQAVERIETDFRAKLANSEFPVEGLSVDDEDAVFEGTPLSDCSRAQKIIVGAALYLAQTGEMKPVIEDGSFLDDKSKRRLAQMCADAGQQLFLEQVTTSDPHSEGVCTIVMEDGATRPPADVEKALAEVAG